MSDLLYQTDSYLKVFDAIVTDVNGDWIALDRTAFYPGGGGQPYDLGTLGAAGQTWNVLKVKKEGDTVRHQLDAREGPVPPAGPCKIAISRQIPAPSRARGAGDYWGLGRESAIMR